MDGRGRAPKKWHRRQSHGERPGDRDQQLVTATQVRPFVAQHGRHLPGGQLA
jgi:hypothetical protein